MGAKMGHMSQTLIGAVAVVCLVGSAHFVSQLFMWISAPVSLPLPDTPSEPYPFFNIPAIKSAPISLVVPCQAEDFLFIPLFLESLANQTVAPAATHLILNLPSASSDGAKLDLLDMEDDRAWLKSMIPHQQSSIPDSNASYPVVLEAILKGTAPASLSLQSIRHLTLHFRAGKHYAGDNRMYGANVSKADGTDIVSFFDCDDYLHPQRTEYVWKMFEEHSELEALIHNYELIRLSEWKTEFPKFMEPKEYLPENQTLIWSYEEIHDRLPIKAFENETLGEPRQEKGSQWYFPIDMDLPRRKPWWPAGHNGWLTIKRDTVESVPYPVDLARGQDSLYNWRLIREKRNFNIIPIVLAAYLRQR
eukprot:Protomagalhaensia_sp_Gyna_25__5122@NODE_594_length_3046_cov_78_792484_g460_i1_p1_GENE_NODE_594_length_3046_cov_78_792484_g460_i1NODE_594_length_3046_cov_78_792484_g460_i1_p1_ORF_typecomplete_len362_score40_07Glyco_tranf_2_3/PF13641_6/0_00022Glycos_transf_2/PF00535_26/4_1e02Glycos_transf_2/PF00535_26/0_0026Glyco_tranf_2_4/PF13704_6/1_1Glyco_tranf_2_4/PF13704_6/1_3e03Osmo_MPGsynth/PF09488_10/0_38_NODE_594_length_3046_cov_78_792484_g460_i1751160